MVQYNVLLIQGSNLKLKGTMTVRTCSLLSFFFLSVCLPLYLSLSCSHTHTHSDTSMCTQSAHSLLAFNCFFFFLFFFFTNHYLEFHTLTSLSAVNCIFVSECVSVHTSVCIWARRIKTELYYHLWVSDTCLIYMVQCLPELSPCMQISRERGGSSYSQVVGTSQLLPDLLLTASSWLYSEEILTL